MVRPTLDQRLALRERPRGIAVMRQRWSDLLFLHWRVDPDLLRSALPDGLSLDLHHDEAWLGIVPFSMERVRPIAMPPVPGLSWFLELNVRTYVHDDDGHPGVWFFSLDCNQPLAVELARSRFHLPYEHAEITLRKDGGLIHYHCRRDGQTGSADYQYAPSGPAAASEPGSLEFFLAERYLLFSANEDGSLFTGQVHHSPYQLAAADCPTWSTEPCFWDQLPSPSSRPDSALYVDHVDVSIFPLKRHSTSSRPIKT